MSADVETMAYRGETPWHGEGFKVSGDESIEQWLEAAGLDWTVANVPLQIEGANDSGGRYRAIMRESDGQVYQVATSRYVPTQNTEIVEFFRGYVEAGDMSMETLGSLKGGSLVWALASIDRSFELAGGDKVEGFALMVNSHDGSMQLSGKTTSVRVVCNNTLSFALSMRGPNDSGPDSRGRNVAFKMRHTRKFGPDEVRDAQRSMGLARDQFEALHETAQELSEARVGSQDRLVEWVYKLTDPADSRELLKVDSDVRQQAAAIPAPPVGGSLIDAALGETERQTATADARRMVEQGDLNRAGKRILDSILTSPGSDTEAARGTYWGAVNGVTAYVDHEAPTKNGNSRLSSAWFGAGEHLKQRAVSLAVDYARTN